MNKYKDLTQKDFEEIVIDYADDFNNRMRTQGMDEEKANKFSLFVLSILSEFESYLYKEMESNHEQA